MAWLETIVDRLIAQPVCGYHAGGFAATEPTAIAALALVANARREASRTAADWLDDLQSDDGSLGVHATAAEPKWPTSLAVLAWIAVDRGKLHASIEHAITWILGLRSNAFPRPPELGHDTTIEAWPWVSETHGWVEPTAMHVLALKAYGLNDHKRTQDGVRMLRNRLLPTGGCNCGNTVVLGGVQLPHVLPTALTMLALSGEQDDQSRIAKSLDYLTREAPRCQATVSRSYALMALAAHSRAHPAASQLLEDAVRRTLRRTAAPFPLAVAALAAADAAQNPLVTLPQAIASP